MKPDNRGLRIFLFLFSALGLISIFLLQHFNYAHYLLKFISIHSADVSKNTIYSINKAVRFILNDAMALVMIYSIFVEKKYVVIGFIVQLFGLLILLPVYLILHNFYYAETKVWLSFLHRLTLNPVLLMLLIPAFYYQKRIYDQSK
jgi:exosortase F-associated protein